MFKLNKYFIFAKKIPMDKDELFYMRESYKIVGAAMEVHKHIGCGFTEAVYQEAFEEELYLQDIPFHQLVLMPGK